MDDFLTPVQSDRIVEKKKRFKNPPFYFVIGLIFFLFMIPFIIPSFKFMDVVAKIMIFSIVVASFDIILGYTGILSFAHGMFFGLGAYSLSLVIYFVEKPQIYHLFLAAIVAVLISIFFALIISFFSLRVKAIFFAMLTLALAEFSHILAVQWTELTGGEDGISIILPGIFNVDFSGGEFFGVLLNGRIMVYFLIIVMTILLFIAMIRFVKSPLGRVLQSIRENEQRATALGYKTFHYQISSIVFGSSFSALAGVLYAMWLCYVNPDSVFHSAIMVNILLMVLIGGMGTLYGSIIGASFYIILENFLPGFLKNIALLATDNQIVRSLADRWQLYFGIIFILVVIFFPKGVIGTGRELFKKT